MVRTQIYLTREERRELATLSRATGRNQSELIREAVDRFLDLGRAGHRRAILKKAAGLWRDREDLPDPGAERRSWDRS